MEKSKALKTMQQAISNIPEGAKIADIYTEHSYGDCKARIIICIEADDCPLNKFHDVAHNAFNTDMGFIS